MVRFFQKQKETSFWTDPQKLDQKSNDWEVGFSWQNTVMNLKWKLYKHIWMVREVTELQIEAILNCKENILEKIYNDWIDWESSQHNEFYSFIAVSLEFMN